MAPACSRAPMASGIERICGPAWSTTRQSASPQQCRPVTAWGSTAARTLDTRSMVRFGSSGKPRAIAAVRPGSSTNTTSGAIGAVSRAALTSARARARTAVPATANARRAGTPRVCRAMPSVTGPVSWSLMGPCRPGHRAQEGPEPDEGLAVDAGVGERGTGIDRGVVELERAVGQHRDAGDAPRGLGDHALHARAVRAATARRAGEAAAPARRWPRRADPSCGRLPIEVARPWARSIDFIPAPPCQRLRQPLVPLVCSPLE